MAEEKKANPARRSRMRGILLGLALGDALGAPHEFRNQVALDKYSGRVEFPLAVVRRFQGGRLMGGLGQITDDTEMAIALARAITQDGKYREETAIAEYLEWANSKCPFMGRNTRELFVGVKTVKGYRGRVEKACVKPQAEWSQSNGCLMRCAPLAALPAREWAADALADCKISNPHPVCVDAVRAYLRGLRALLAGDSAAAATTAAIGRADGAGVDPGVVEAIRQGRDQVARDITANKGWVLHALYCAFFALNDPSPKFQDRIDRIIRLSGDTDTNAAIAGAMLGALFGEDTLRGETRTGPNLVTVLACDTEKTQLRRPAMYSAAHLIPLADQLAAL